MTHPLFARLDEQLRLAEAELENLRTSDAKSHKLRSKSPELYDEWTHRAALAEGIRSVCAALESIMKAIVDEIDRYEPPQGKDWHEKLIDQLAVRVDGVREAMLDAGSKALLHELRRFRHVVHHNYAQNLETKKVFDNYQRLKQAFAAFKRDYKRLSSAMQAPAK
jgi:hypothetical protein